MLQPGDLGGERLRVGAPGGVSRGRGAGLGRTRAGGAEVEASRRVRGAAGLLADGAGALLLAAGAVLQPLLQAADIKDQPTKKAPELAGHCWIQARLKRNGTERERGRGDGPEGVEDVAAGGEAVEVLVGERAEILVADGADRPCGGGGDGHGSGGGIRRGVAGLASPQMWLDLGGKDKTRANPALVSRDFTNFQNTVEISWRAWGGFRALSAQVGRFVFIYKF